MRRRPLGATGISVSELGLGTMMFGRRGNTDREQCIRMVHAALDAGINFIDTADVYSEGESEEILGQALKGKRDQVVLATKFGWPWGADPDRAGGSPRWIKRAVEDSLRRLGTDHIDLYQMHRPDPVTTMDETLAALSDLITAGKVRAIGTSTFPAEHLVEAQWVATARSHRRFTTEQPPYSILLRGVEADVLPLALRHDLGIITYGPLASGWLSGRADPTSGERASIAPKLFDLSIPANAAKLDAVTHLHAVAAEAGLALHQLATAFVRAHPAVTTVLLGPREPQQLDDLLLGADVELDDGVLDRIDEIVPPGTNVNPGDIFFTPPSLADRAARRRR